MKKAIKKKNTKKTSTFPLYLFIGSFALVGLLIALVSFLAYPTRHAEATATGLTTIAQSSSYLGIGKITNRDLIQTSDGTLHTFIQTYNTPNNCPLVSGNTPGLGWFTSTDHGATWTCKATIQALMGGASFTSAVADSNDNIYLVYATPAPLTYSVFYRKLTKNTTGWTVGNEQLALALVQGKTNYGQPSLTLDGQNRLWLAVQTTNQVINQRTADVYFSDGTSDAPVWTHSATLDIQTTYATTHVPVLLHYANNLAVFYESNTTKALVWRHRIDTDATALWSPETQIASITGADPAFQAVADTTGNIHIVFSKNGESSGSQIQYISYNAQSGSWGPEINMDGGMGANAYPSITTDGTKVYVFYGSRPITATAFQACIGTGCTNNQLSMGFSSTTLGTYAYRVGTAPFTAANFSAPIIINKADRLFDKIYTQSANNTLIDKTASLCRTSIPVGSQTNDVLYFGNKDPYRAIMGSLGTAGIGGNAVYEYWNGSAWTSLTTLEQSSHPDFSNNSAYGYGMLFTPPADWEPTVLDTTTDTTSYYYIRARITSPYTTTPTANCLWDFPDGAMLQTVAHVTGSTIPVEWVDTIFGQGNSRVRFTTIPLQ